MENSKRRPKKNHEVGLDHRREFDEVFVSNAFVHVERMGNRSFWIGIDPPPNSDLPRLSINTGVYGGEWYFTVQEDMLKADGGRFFRVCKPTKYMKKPKSAASPEHPTHPNPIQRR